MRWALFVERMWPDSAAEIDAPFSTAEPDESRARRAKAQLALADLRAAIYPEDD